jgi:hypothetical protein
MNVRKGFNSQRIANVYLGWIIIFAIAMVALYIWVTVPSSLPGQVQVCTGSAAQRDFVCRWTEPDTAYLIGQYYLPAIAFAVVYYAIRIGLLYIWKPFSRPKVFSNLWLYGLVAGGILDVSLAVFYLIDIATGGVAWNFVYIQYALIWAFILQVIGLVVGASRNVSSR